ncbi:glycosyltransferase family 2 protein [Sinimarinibacterium flocculans]|mgnify:CR=1 FL=1|uniref:Glycosyltransferase involved in cell wall biosynthesis n=1 Tax=Sinimarinibacterium flocculans TaxID=985250 RepID=A0A318EIE0_9GAMM|nr:glycosyltransferase family 2 protein [Sinimarinibacterium flocculans]PXV70645.1 glycosyltransferase involved in cell wall biosynthesis [Sinimarinibacterium flocculans]
MHAESAHTAPPPLFTVLIPTYNRARLLLRALDSVAAQGWRDFEILLVDDGSTDGSLAAALRWSRRRDQPLRWLRQAHAGVHAAYNSGVAAALGELVVVLGSDDLLLPDSLTRLARAWHAIPSSRRAMYCGIAGHGVHWRSGRLVGDRYPAAIWDADHLELKLGRRIGGDKPGAYRRDLLLQHPFPVFAGEPFMRESFVLKRLALDYRTRYLDEVFQLFDYQQDGLSARVRDLRRRSPRGLRLYFREDANRYTVAYGMAARYGAHVRYVRHALASGAGLRALWREMRHKGWLLAGLVPGTLKWLRDCWVLAAQRRADQRPPAQREPAAGDFQRGSSMS